MPPFARNLILASRSPRRRELLAAAGYQFEVVDPSPTAECGVCSRESPAELVVRLAYEKAADVARRVGSGLILGCDTVAECDGQVLGKPPDMIWPGGCSNCCAAKNIACSAEFGLELSDSAARHAVGGHAAADGINSRREMDEYLGLVPVGRQSRRVWLSGPARLDSDSRRERIECGRAADGVAGSDARQNSPATRSAQSRARLCVVRFSVDRFSFPSIRRPACAGQDVFRGHVAAFQIGQIGFHQIGWHGVRFDSAGAGNVDAHDFARQIDQRSAALGRSQHGVVLNDGRKIG